LARTLKASINASASTSRGSALSALTKAAFGAPADPRALAGSRATYRPKFG